jgi:cytochrome c oxidase cbb3-type subunit 3
MSVKDRDPLTGHRTTGHEWNGITELNTPVPKVVWFFIIVTHVWAVAIWFLLPTWPFFTGYTKGLLGLDQRSQVEASVAEAALDRGAAWSDAVAAASLDQIRVTPGLMEVVNTTGPALFGDNCAVCHGADGAGGPGFPSLVDDAWLWGGDDETVLETIRVGINSAHPETRVGQMLAFGRDGILTRDQVRTVAAYVQSLSGASEADAATVEEGAGLFAENCVSCHGEDGRGLTEMGAPDLTDGFWIYGGDSAALFTTIYGGRQGHMPAWESRLSLADRKILAVYVLGLGAEDAAAAE